MLAGGVAAALLVCLLETFLVRRVPLLKPVPLPEHVYDGQSGVKLKKPDTEDTQD